MCGPRISSAPRRKRGALRSVRGTPSVASARKTWMAGLSGAKTRFALLPGHDEEDQLSPGKLVNALSITSPIGCQALPSNCTSRICLIGRKSVGPVLMAMPGSAMGF